VGAVVVPAEGFSARAAQLAAVARELDEALAGLEEPLRCYREGLERWRELASLPPAGGEVLAGRD
jgi:exonuclease VII small subunit